MDIILATHMSGSGRVELYGNGFKSNDSMPGPVAKAFKQIGVDYREPFTCIAVYGPEENPHDRSLPAWAWGPPVILKSEVLDKLEVACAADIQNAASGHNTQRIKRLFCNLSGVSEKEKALLRLLRMRPTNAWTEARMFDLLRDVDVAEDRYRAEMAVDSLFRRY